MTTYKFIDLFSGCGGLSLGLTMAGLEGLFAIERDSMAFETFSENFLGTRELPVKKFSWPSWLDKCAWAIDDLLASHLPDLKKLAGTVDVLAGGPPCQGFSFAGKREESDPRNMLFEKYVQVVAAIKPKALVVENVPGMLVAHSSKGTDKNGRPQSSESYYHKLKRRLEDIGYEVHGKIVDASRFGVPQRRPRLIVIGLTKQLAAQLEGGIDRAFAILEAKRFAQLVDLRLPDTVSAKSAISDLEVGERLQACTDPFSPARYQEAVYSGPDRDSSYQMLMHKDCRNDEMDSMRLAKHRDDVRERFARILSEPEEIRP
jgi:DNA (cytosine-5)-methyltransferase 1